LSKTESVAGTFLTWLMSLATVGVEVGVSDRVVDGDHLPGVDFMVLRLHQKQYLS
jgi:hypothetical protein